ncbi:unnamed protein product [Kluyveromyces dobzhanskii CBS 2104]|uniref:Endopolyphosphatase n=1 Tax=Kluyveromyces dobzhanskii CBS 2104 TaxID=1427455 RepID=A0A0A8L1S7_9SACH|nr:unnamed protein product [Kluyveromyces dobzhanskii CBS 2104]
MDKWQYSTVSSEELPISSERLASLGLTPNRAVKVTDLRGNSHRGSIKGRFLQITDLHPDLYYKEGSSIETACHRGEPNDKGDRAARFGNAMMGCDGPPDLMYYTLDWIQENLANEIDFIIWTGDNVRHDNDRKIPRTEQQIFDMNRHVSDLFVKTFKDHDSEDPRQFKVKVIPSLGNNDVFPHNMFSPGPTLQTRELYNIWNQFIPPEQQNTFDRYTSFFVEVIPGKLAIISFNTLYMFKGNPLVDNCTNKKQPGYKMLLWIGYTLQELRNRGIKVWLSGHVPPIPKNFDSSCSDKLALWLHEYSDIIIGGFYGHMNLDHFVPIDGEQAWEDVANAIATSEFSEFSEQDFLADAIAARQIRAQGAKPVNKVNYMNNVRDSYYSEISKKIKKLSKSDPFFERFSMVHVSTSIIPTFNPGFRVWEYNITDLQTQEAAVHQNQPWDLFFQNLDDEIDQILNDSEVDEDEDDSRSLFEALDSLLKKNKKNKKGKKGKKSKDWWKTDKTFPKIKPDGLPPGPAYENQLFSPLRFVQYYADLKQINKDYLKLLKDGKSKEEAASIAFKYQVEYTSDAEPYPMENVLVKDYIKLASDLSENDKLWEVFLERAFCSSGYKD